MPINKPQGGKHDPAIYKVEWCAREPVNDITVYVFRSIYIKIASQNLPEQKEPDSQLSRASHTL